MDDAQLAIMSRGTGIGELARDYFPGGVMAVEGEYPTRESAARTLELIGQGIETIYEATFIHDDALVAVDILTRLDGGWRLFECKGTTQVKDYHIRDLAVQVYVVAGAGIPLVDASVMHLNNQYVRRGELDVSGLFTHESLWNRIMAMQRDIPQRLQEFREMLEEGEPEIEMGNHCTSPYPCDFQNYCQGLLPSSESDAVDEEVSSPLVDHESIRGWLGRFGYPLYFLDFETMMPAIPMFDEARPYQQIPFQYSLHYLPGKGAELVHSEYLAHPTGDPRPELIRTLVANTRMPGNILAYSAQFERNRLRELARDFPENADGLTDILARIDDLALVFQRKSFHFPHLGRKYSIKRILPLLVPDLSYNDLEINNGGDASALFEQLYNSTDTELIEKTRQDLLRYCHLDTLAMVRILGELEGY